MKLEVSLGYVARPCLKFHPFQKRIEAEYCTHTWELRQEDHWPAWATQRDVCSIPLDPKLFGRLTEEHASLSLEL